MTGPIRVGIVGANPDRGWGRDAHLPALRALPQFSIAAVSARTQEGADRAAAAFGAPRGLGDSLELARDPDVDVVVVTVKVPEHRAVVLAALAAGKHVYCEWPLGVDLAEAREMAAAVPAGVHAVIGLQGLSAPAIRQAVRLVEDGAIGTPRVLRVFATAAAWGETADPNAAYLQDRRNGATLETIGGGHTLAAIEALVGPYVEVDARNSILRPKVPVAGTGELVDRTSADHMFVIGAHDSGCVSGLEVLGGTSTRPALFEVQGSEGWLRVVGTVPGTYQIPRLAIEASVPVPALADPVPPGLIGPPANLAEVYTRLAGDLQAGTRTLPDFAAAVRLTALLEAIDRASATGARQAP
ncbi:Gfo/Idh/MocA family protein [Trujillonella endophytica]|uniref:Predicted dehydrogenase n=1 Tax=Trujillonella endophytica TaxID=673521 RepID=A0A1H8Q5T8_9ACTN|nr:Gfo/Idh/MocA family oxidoreductase [Trujillella endophytica]SEO49388.1 Predicted dehydrogenase [Trujillella endophytica]